MTTKEVKREYSLLWFSGASHGDPPSSPVHRELYGRSNCRNLWDPNILSSRCVLSLSSFLEEINWWWVLRCGMFLFVQNYKTMRSRELPAGQDTDAAWEGEGYAWSRRNFQIDYRWGGVCVNIAQYLPRWVVFFRFGRLYRGALYALYVLFPHR